MNPLDQLLAIEQIKQLKSRYFRCMDTKDWVGLRAVFSDDAVFDARASLSLDGSGEGPAAESNDWIYHGGDVIAAFVRDTVTPLRTVHHGHGHEIEIQSDTEARGIIAMEDKVWDLESGAPILHGCGHYHESYIRKDGSWRIKASRLSRLHLTLG